MKLSALIAGNARGKAAPVVDPLAVFGLPAERNIFRFHDGQQMRAIDPLVAWEVFALSDFEPKADFDGVDQGEPDAIARMLALAGKMFGVQAFDPATGKGLTRDELSRLFLQFLNYIDELKKKHDSLPITFRPTASASSPPSDSTTPPAADCSSTPTASPSAPVSTP